MRSHLFLLLVLYIGVSSAQELPSNYSIKKVAVKDTLFIDKVSINPIYFKITDNNGLTISPDDYQLDFSKSRIVFKKEVIHSNDSLTIRYLKYPEFLTKDYFIIDTNVIVKSSSSINKLYALQESTNKSEFKPFDGLSTLGSLSRGVTVGNNQNAVVNSSLNLQMTGKLSDKV